MSQQHQQNHYLRTDSNLFKLSQYFIAVLITCKNEGDPIDSGIDFLLNLIVSDQLCLKFQLIQDCMGVLLTYDDKDLFQNGGSRVVTTSLQL